MDEVEEYLEAGKRLEESDASRPQDDIIGWAAEEFEEDARERLPRYRRAIEAVCAALPLDTDCSYDHGWNDALTHVYALMESALLGEEKADA